MNDLINAAVGDLAGFIASDAEVRGAGAQITRLKAQFMAAGSPPSYAADISALLVEWDDRQGLRGVVTDTSGYGRVELGRQAEKLADALAAGQSSPGFHAPPPPPGALDALTSALIISGLIAGGFLIWKTYAEKKGK